MALLFFNIKKFIPTNYNKTIFDIDYNKLYEKGKKIILFDVDNTLIPYDLTDPTKEIIDLFENIKKIGFKIALISNNNKYRIEKVARVCDIPYIAKATKPLKSGFKRALRILKVSNKSEVVVVGDQIMTDVFGARRMGLDVILVKPIKKKSEKWYTKINRMFEGRVLKEMKNVNNEMYNLIIEMEDKNEK